MRRRRFLAAAALTATLPSAHAQARLKRLAVLSAYLHQPPTQEEKAEYARAFEQHGFQDKKNLEIRWYEFPLRNAGEGAADAAIARLLTDKPDCIDVGGENFARLLQENTRIIPIVVRMQGDPVAMGFAQSLVRPGGNITGMHSGEHEVSLKRVELLREFVPGLKRVTWIAFASQRTWFPSFEQAATAAGLEVREVNPGDADAPGFEKLGVRLAALRAEGFAAGHLHSGVPAVIAAVTQAALEHRIAVSYSGDFTRWQTEGLLFLYSGRTRLAGQTLNDRAAAMIAAIMRGRRPADIPFQGPAGYYLVLNAKTAARIGLTVPPQVALLADQVAQ